jgi:hypothetical protein
MSQIPEYVCADGKLYKVQIDRAEIRTLNVSLIPVLAIRHSVHPEDILIAIQELISEARAKEIYTTEQLYGNPRTGNDD